MNIKNNKRRRNSVEKIEKAFMELLQTRDLKDVTVSDICKLTGLNRSTFYANFQDVYNLAERIREQLEQDFSSLFQKTDPMSWLETGAFTMFCHIRDHQLFYTTYFKLEPYAKNRVMTYDQIRAEQDFHNEHLEYHIEFFRHGLNAVIKLWLQNGCKETPEEMEQILKAEYRGR